MTPADREKLVRASEATFVVVLDNYTRKVNSPCHCATCERDKNAAYTEVLRLYREARNGK